MKQDILRKLTSRKLWVALADFVGMLIVAFGVAEETAAQVAAIIMAGAGVLGYLLAEGLVDKAGAEVSSFYVTASSSREGPLKKASDNQAGSIQIALAIGSVS